MISIGITGTVAAGKSSVGRLFEEWGARRIDADELAREVVRPGSEALKSIREEWGDRVVAADGTLDRTAMRRIAFGKEGARERLEEIVHPEVARLRRARLEEAERAGAGVVVSEIPLLFETDLADSFELVIVVDAPREERRRRVLERGVAPETFAALEAAQWPAAEKRAAADIVIDNDGSRERLKRRARRVWTRLAAASGGASGGETG